MEVLAGYLHTNNSLIARNIAAIRKGKGSLRFDKALLFLNGGCNLNCYGCYTGAPQGDSRRLDLATIQRILEFAHVRGITYLVIPGHGEPLMDPDFFTVLEEAQKLGLRPVVYSNGTKINANSAARLRELNVQLLLKRNSMNHSRQDFLVDCPGASHRMAEGLDHLVAAGYDERSLFLESYILHSLKEDLKDVLRYCRKRGLSPYFEAFERVPGKIPPQLAADLLSDAELTEFFNTLASIDKKEFGIDVSIPEGCRVYSLGLGSSVEDNEKEGNGCCDRVFTSFCVAHDGAVRLCVDHLKTIGNVNDGDLEEILDPGNHQLREVFEKPCSYQSASYRKDGSRSCEST